MKKISITLSIILLSLLFIIFFLSPYHKINQIKDLDKFEKNNKILVEGKVTNERNFGDSKILTLDNGIEIICRCSSLLNKNISVRGLIDDFTGERRIKPLSIKVK